MNKKNNKTPNPIDIDSFNQPMGTVPAEWIKKRPKRANKGRKR